VADLESVRRNCTPTKAMTVGIIARYCGNAASYLGSQEEELRVVKGSEDIVGSLRERWLG
jgi:hypothetical protein